MTKSGAPTAPAGELPSGRLDEEGWPVLKPTLLTVHRTSPEDVKTRQVIFSLDGKKIGQLLYGESLTREIPPGRHSLRANNTLVWRTVEFDADLMTPSYGLIFCSTNHFGLTRKIFPFETG